MLMLQCPEALSSDKVPMALLNTFDFLVDKINNSASPIKSDFISLLGKVANLICTVSANQLQLDGKSLLHLAIVTNDYDLTTLLINELKSLVNINAIDHAGYTPLGYAILKGHYQNAQLLVDNGADINMQFRSINYINFAILHEQFHIAELLLNRGSYTLSTATYAQIKQIATYVLINKHSSLKNLLVKPLDQHGNTVMHLAAMQGDLFIKPLMEHKVDLGVDLDIQNDEGSTPLHNAVINHKLEMIKLLTTFGANVNIKNEDNLSPLAYALVTGDINAAEVLIAYGAHIVDKHIKELKAIYNATIQHPNSAIKNLFIQPINHDSGVTFLHIMSYLVNDNLFFNTLLKKTLLDINVKDNNDLTPIMYATIKGNQETILSLLDNGAYFNAPLIKYPLLCISLKKGYSEISALLVARGAKCEGYIDAILEALSGLINLAGVKNILESTNINLLSTYVLTGYLIDEVLPQHINVHPTFKNVLKASSYSISASIVKNIIHLCSKETNSVAEMIEQFVDKKNSDIKNKYIYLKEFSDCRDGYIKISTYIDSDYRTTNLCYKHDILTMNSQFELSHHLINFISLRNEQYRMLSQGECISNETEVVTFLSSEGLWYKICEIVTL